MFVGHRHYGSGDEMALVAKEKNSRCSRFIPLLLSISKGHVLEAHGISRN